MVITNKGKELRRTMKKTIAIIALVVLVAVASVLGTLAYLTDTKTATNTFTVGNVKI